MELRHLKTFLAVAENKSFIGAGKLLHLSQPAVTAQVQKLEEYLGVQLLERDRRGVRLTAAGEVFVSGARSTLLCAEDAVIAVQRAARGQTEQVRVSFLPGGSLELGPDVMTELLRQHPEAKLSVSSLHTSLTLDALRKNSIDIGYVRLPVDAPDLKIAPVHKEHFVVCLPKTHRLAEETEIDLADLRKEKFLLYDRKWAPGLHDMMMEMFQQAGFKPIVADILNEMYVAPALIRMGVGIAVLPEMVVGKHAEGMVIRRIRNCRYASRIGVAMRRTDDSPLVKAILSISKAIGRRKSVAGAPSG